MREEIQSFLNELNPWLATHGLRILLFLVGAFIVKLIAKRFIEKAVRISVKHYEKNSPQDEKLREDTLIRVFALAINYALLAIVVMMILQEVGIPIGPMLAGAGIFGIAIGFGSQYLIRDIISGFFVIMENQYRIGDVVNFDDATGKVEDISLRITTLRDRDGTIHHIPHGEIKKVSNYSKSNACVNLNIPVRYDSNIDKVIATVNIVGADLSQDPEWKGLIIKPIHFLRVEDFSDSAIIVKIIGETLPLKQWKVTGELRKRIKEAFDKAGIEMPTHDRSYRQAVSLPKAP